nr:hypothetical protein [Tanacetum cinerariifolium]
LKQRVKKLKRKNKLKVIGLRRLRKIGTAQRVKSSVDTIMDDQEDTSKQGEIIANIDVDEDVTLKDVDDDELEPVELKGVVEVVTTATTLNTAALIAARKRKGIVIRDLKETATPSIIIHSEPKSKDKGKRILKEDNVVLRYQTLKRKPQTEAQAKKNMMIYLKNMVGFKMDYFKGINYDDIRLIFKKYFNSKVAFLEKPKEQLEEEASRALKRKSESQEEKAAKKQKLDKEVEELKKHLQIVLNDKDDVYTKATPLARK